MTTAAHLVIAITLALVVSGCEQRTASEAPSPSSATTSEGASAGDAADTGIIEVQVSYAGTSVVDLDARMDRGAPPPVLWGH